jgi:hypothetical protein
MPATGNRATLNTTSLSATATPSQRVTSKDAASAHSADTDAPEYRYYAKTITTPHLDTSGPGTATYAGSGLTRILGLNLHIKSAEGEMDIQTGTTTTSTLLGEAVTVSWVALDLNGATLALTSTTPILLPTPSVSVTATGTLTLHRPAQDATTDGRIAFDASVTPDGNSARIVRSSAVVVRASPYSLGGVNFPLILGGLVVASAGGAALGLILRRRQAARAALVAQKRPIPVVVDTRGGTVAESEPADEVGLAQAAAIMECAEVAASECEWRLALDLVASARRLDPRDWQLAATQALWFERAGALDQAMGAYDEARALGMREADVCSAICALKKDDEELAVAYLARAVDLAPENVREITSEPILARLRARADVEALLRSARSRLDAA